MNLDGSQSHRSEYLYSTGSQLTGINRASIIIDEINVAPLMT